MTVQTMQYSIHSATMWVSNEILLQKDFLRIPHEPNKRYAKRLSLGILQGFYVMYVKSFWERY